MKKKHQIKTIDDIKYCEKHKIDICSDSPEKSYYRFDGNVWSFYMKERLLEYNTGLFLSNTFYYYEEQEQQEATKNDIGKLCFGWNYDDEEKDLGVLEDYDISDSDKYYLAGLDWYYHCRPLTKEEIKEFMEKAE